MKLGSLGIEFARDLCTLSLNVKLICLSYLLFSFGDGLFCFFLPVQITQLGASSIQVGFLYSINSLVIGISLLLGGPLADRFNVKKIIILGTLLFVPVPIIMGIATSWEQLFIPMILYGTSIISTPLSVIIILSSKGKTMQAFGLLSASGAAAYIIAPFTGGIISSFAGQKATFFVASLFFMFSLTPLLAVRSQPKAKEPDFSTEDVPVSHSTKKLVLLCCFLSSSMFLIFMINPLVSQFVNSFYNSTVADLGFLGAFTGLGTIFFSFIIGRIGDKHSHVTSISASLAISAFAFLVVTIFNNFPLLCFAFFLNGASQAVLYMSTGIIGAAAPKHSMGKWAGLSQSIIYLVGFGAPTIGGLLYEVSPYLTFYSVIITLFILASIGVFFDARVNILSKMQSVKRKLLRRDKHADS
jgi:MFS family permease